MLVCMAVYTGTDTQTQSCIYSKPQMPTYNFSTSFALVLAHGIQHNDEVEIVPQCSFSIVLCSALYDYSFLSFFVGSSFFLH